MRRISNIFILVLFLVSTSCSKNDKPYNEFESELKAAICNCVGLDTHNFTDEQFLQEYEKCQKETSSLLKYGLDKYSEDSRLSKMNYRSKMDRIVLQLADQCMRKYGKENPIRNEN